MVMAGFATETMSLRNFRTRRPGNCHVDDVAVLDRNSGSREGRRIAQIHLVDHRDRAVGRPCGRGLEVEELLVLEAEDEDTAGVGAFVVQAAGARQAWAWEMPWASKGISSFLPVAPSTEKLWAGRAR
jgi:hypothetical protein